MDYNSFHSNGQPSTIEDIEQGVLEFIKTITTVSQIPKNLEEFSDGIVLMQILSKINSAIFDMKEIVNETSDNQNLRHKNIKVIVRGIETYYSEVLKMSKFEIENYLDITEISKNKNRLEVIKLIELVLGVIVQSEQKSEFILAITHLEKKHQTMLMHLMEKWVIPERLDGQMCNLDDYTSNSSVDSSRLSLGVPNQFNSYFMTQQQEQNGILLKKIDDLGCENYQLAQKVDEIKVDLEEKIRKIEDCEREIHSKDEEIRKLKLTTDSVMLSLGLGLHDNNIEGVIQEKNARIEQLNAIVNGMRGQTDIQNSNLKDEIDLLGKKIKQLQKANETLDFYKEKYQEFNQMVEKCQEQDKKTKQFEIQMREKDEQNQMLMGKLQEFRESFQDEKRKVLEKTIEITEKDNQLECMQRENEKIQRNFHQQEDKLFEISLTLDKLLQEDPQIQESKMLSQMKQSQTFVREKETNQGMKGLNEDLGQIICDLERENTILKCEANITNHIDPSQINIEDSNSLKKQLNLLQSNLEEAIIEKIQLAAKVKNLSKIDVDQLMNENQKLKGDYQLLLAKTIQRKELLSKQIGESSLREANQQLTEKEEEIQSRKLEIEGKQIQIVRLLKDKADNEKIITELHSQISQLTEERDLLQDHFEISSKKCGSQNDNFLILFQNKNDQIEIISNVLSELRQKYNLLIQQSKTKAVFS